MITFAPHVHAALRTLCERYRVSRLDLTGSAARDDFDPVRSDIDLLIEFLPDARVSAIDFVELANALERLFGRRVDLLELSAVSNPLLRTELTRDVLPFYAAA